MAKKVAILAVAMVWLWGTHLLSGYTPQVPRRSKSPLRHASSRTSVHRTTRGQRVRGKSVKIRRVRGRRRRPWRSPWRLSSFGEPGALDNPTGEDPAVREAAVKALEDWNGSVVVADPNTGRVLTIVNQRLAVEGAFTPCSAFKPIVALAALKEGIVKPETQVRVGRRTRMTLIEALAVSNNPYFAKLGRRLGLRRLTKYAHEFGLGQKAGWKIPDEVSGRFPSAPARVGDTGLVASHGLEVEVTPLQMAAAFSAIANGGTLYALQYPRTAEEIEHFEPRVRRHLDGVDEHIPQVKEGLAAAVLYGTGRWAYDPRLEVFGKTGTCSEDGARLGWFVSFSNEQRPKYVVVVLLRGGRPMFGPHAAEIAGRIYRDLRDREERATQAAGASAPSSSHR